MLFRSVPPPQAPGYRSLPQPVVGGTAPPPDFDVVPMNNNMMAPQLPARGVVLSPGVLTIMLVLVGLLIGLAFVLGLLLGRSQVGDGPAPKQAQRTLGTADDRYATATSHVCRGYRQRMRNNV